MTATESNIDVDKSEVDALNFQKSVHFEKKLRLELQKMINAEERGTKLKTITGMLHARKDALSQSAGLDAAKITVLIANLERDFGTAGAEESPGLLGAPGAETDPEQNGESKKDPVGVAACRIIQNPSRELVEDPYRGKFVTWDRPGLVPFKVTRANYMWDVPEGVVRGHHAHEIVHELCVCLQGAMTVTVEDGTGTKSMRISSPTEAALIAPPCWILLHDFAPGTILLVYCSHDHDPSECIRDREVFDAKYGSPISSKKRRLQE